MGTLLHIASAVCIALAWTALGGSGVALGRGQIAASDGLCWVGTVTIVAGWVLAYIAGRVGQ